MNVTIKIDRRTARRVAQMLRRAPKTMNRELRIGLRNIGQFIRNELKKTVNGQGFTPIGVTGRLSTNNIAVIHQSLGAMSLEVYAGEQYAAVVEYGRKPGKFPPWSSQQFLLWVRLRTRGVTRATETRAGRIRDAEKETRSIAFLIARKIAEEGTEPTFYFRRTVTKPRVQRFTNFALNRSVEKAVRVLNG